MRGGMKGTLVGEGKSRSRGIGKGEGTSQVNAGNRDHVGEKGIGVSQWKLTMYEKTKLYGNSLPYKLTYNIVYKGKRSLNIGASQRSMLLLSEGEGYWMNISVPGMGQYGTIMAQGYGGSVDELQPRIPQTWGGQRLAPSPLLTWHHKATSPLGGEGHDASPTNCLSGMPQGISKHHRLLLLVAYNK